MQTVQQARRILTAIVVIFLIVDIAAAIVLMSPAGRSADQRGAEYEALRMERQQKDAETRPTRDMDKKLVLAREQVADFYRTRLPRSFSEISDNLGRIAKENRVDMSAVRYETKPTNITGLTSVVITVSMSGDYASEIRFVNALEREKKFYILDRLQIGDSGGNQVRVELQLETYLRNAA